MRPRILIVEDDLVTRTNLSVLLKDEGYDVAEAADGLQALEILDRREFDLVLSDVVMPGLDGLKLLQWVKSSLPQIPVVIMTSYVSSSLASTPAGAAELIRKPVLLDELLAKLERTLRSSADGYRH